MKIIDLINSIYQGKQPQRIIFDTEKYIWCEEQQEYRRYPYDNNLYYSLWSDYDLTKCLNDEVEIIEEDKEIEKLENEIEFYSYSKYEELKNDVDKILYILKAINLTENKISNLNNKLNELIDKVNSLEKKQ